MRFHLVLQWPLSSLNGFDEILNIEDLLIAKLTDQSDVDGHDFGSGEANIFGGRDRVQCSVRLFEYWEEDVRLIRDLPGPFPCCGSSCTIRNMKTKQLHFSYALVLFGIFATAPAPVLGQHMNEKDSPCTSVVVTSDLVSCFSKARDEADAKLNSLYNRLRQKLEGEDANRLVETERTWMKYRDENCSAERGLYGAGTAAQPAYLACSESMTRARTKELQVTYAARLKD